MSKTRLKYDIIAKRAEETESGVNIDLALMRRKTEIQNISNTLSQTIAEVQEMDEIVTSAAEIAMSVDERLDEVEEVASETSAELLQLEDYVHGIDEELDDKLDKSESANYYPRHENPEGYLTDSDLSEYAKQQWVEDQGYLKAADLSDYAKTADVNEEFDNTSAWAKSVFASATQLSDYYTKTETSGAAEIEEALKGYQPSGQYVTSAGFNAAIDNYYQKNETSGASELSREFYKYQTKGEYVTSAGLTAGLLPYAKTADVNHTIVEATSGKLDKSSSGEFYPMHTNPSGYLTEHQDLSSYATKQYVTDNTSAFITSSYLDPYAKTTFVNEELGKKQDTSEMSAYATSSWADGRFQPKGDYVETSELDNYYTKSETSGASEIRDALAEKAPVGDYVESSELTDILNDYATKLWVDTEGYIKDSDLDAILEDYVTSADFEDAIEDYYKKSETSGATELEAEFKKYQTSGQYVTSAGLHRVLDDYKTASEVEDDLADTSAWAKSVFASAAQLSDYATTQDLRDGLNEKLDKTESANYYPRTGNPSNFLVQADLAGYATEHYVEQETSGKLDKSESANYWPQATANEVIPAGTDDSNQLVNELGLAEALANFGGFKKSTPDSSGKPTETVPNTKTIYLTYIDSATGPDKYNEWIWDSAGNDYELIGETTLDLTGYATERYVDQHTSGKIDWASSGQFYLATNPDGFIDTTALEPYAQTTYVDAGLNKKFDTSAMSAYAESAWVAANFQSAGQFVTSAGFNEAIAEYYKKTETSGAAELTAEFAKYQLEGDYVTSAGLTEKLNETSAWANETFQPVGSYATTTDLDNTSAWAKATFASASNLDDYYPTTNPSGFLTNSDLTGLATETYVLTQTSGKMDKSSSGAFYPATNPDHFVTSGELATLSAKIESDIPSLEGYATEEWVGQQGYLTSVPAEYVTDTEMGTAIEAATSAKMDKSTSAQFYPRSTNPEHYVTSGELSTLSAKIEEDIPSIEGLAAETWVQANFASASQLDDYYPANNPSGFLTSDDVAQSDWTETDSADPAYIKNKPAALSMAAGEGIQIVESNNTITFSVSGDYAERSDLDDYYPKTNPSGFLTEIPSEYVTDTELQTALDDYGTSAWVLDQLDEKVDKEPDMGLSHEDFTSAYKDKLDHIEASANKNVQADWTESDSASDAFIQHKPVQLSMAAGEGISITENANTLTFSVSGDFATNDDLNYVSAHIPSLAGYATENYVQQETSGKVDKVTGKELSTNDFTDALLDKLNTIETSAQMNVQSDWTETNSAANSYIAHKPDPVTLSAGPNVSITEVGGQIVIGATVPEVSGKADKVSSATQGHLAALSSDGNLLDSTYSPASFATSAEMDAVESKIPANATPQNQLVTRSDLDAAATGAFDIVPLGANDQPDVPYPNGKTIYLTKDSSLQVTDPYTEWIWLSGTSAFEVIGETTIDLTDYATQNYVLSQTSGKVDKVTGMGLSHVDFTSAYQSKLDSISPSAEVNVQSDWNVTNSALDSYIWNKPDIIVPLASTSFSAPKKLVVVTAMPAAANIDPDTIYLVKENVS